MSPPLIDGNTLHRFLFQYDWAHISCTLFIYRWSRNDCQKIMLKDDNYQCYKDDRCYKFTSNDPCYKITMIDYEQLFKSANQVAFHRWWATDRADLGGRCHISRCWGSPSSSSSSSSPTSSSLPSPPSSSLVGHRTEMGGRCQTLRCWAGRGEMWSVRGKEVGGKMIYFEKVFASL